MNKQRDYPCNLRGVDVENYKLKPIVNFGFSYEPKHFAGTASIMWGKYRVNVTYVHGPPPYEHALGTSIIEHSDGSRELLGLSVIPLQHVEAGDDN